MTRFARYKKTHVESTPFHEYMRDGKPSDSRAAAKQRDKSSTSLAAKKMVCFGCRKRGHSFVDCKSNPNSKADGSQQTSVDDSLNHGAILCYRCGEPTHTLGQCRVARKNDPKNENREFLPFAECFTCKETGHLASQCSINQSKGIYPKGGSCHICKSVMHLARDCPTRRQSPTEDDMKTSSKTKVVKPVVKVVKF